MKFRIVFCSILCTVGLINNVFSQSRINVVNPAQFNNPNNIDITKVSFRGLSVPNDQNIWASGSHGTIAKSLNGGKTFTISAIEGYENSDFRDIEAFDENTAIVMSSGTPTFILKTTNGGKTWKRVFESYDKEVFLDAMDFWDSNNGMVVGDPIDERFVLYKTFDGGNTWQEMDTSTRPWAIPGESLFAASGSCFKCMPKNSIAFVSGGTKSVLHWLQINKKYQRYELKFMKQGKNSEGAFAFDFNKDHIIIVGGDYAADSLRVKQGIFQYNYSKDGLELLNLKPFYSNYRSDIKLLNNGDFITCGTKGVDINNPELTTTISNASTQISSESFNVIQKSKKGTLVVLAGSKGKIGVLR
jgi:photosystem II stability/assembly factor-like uncharacterized protein